MKKLPFNFSVQANADSPAPAEISIRGVIGRYIDAEMYSVSDTEEDVLNELNKIPKEKKINVRINSPGGDVGLALGCYNALARRAQDITTFNDGYACSSAAILMLAGSRRISPTGSIWMIHCASSETSGNAADKRKDAEMLDTHDKVMSGLLAKTAGGTPDEWFKKMQAETWMTGEEAVEMKLAHEAPDIAIESGGGEPDAEFQRVVRSFKHIPDNLRSRFLVSATAEVPPPTQEQKQQPTKVKSMKQIITALVTAGYVIPADADENQVLPHITALLAERTSLKTENQGHLDARKLRVTGLLDTAVTDKIILPARKDSLLALGTANAAGESEVFAQIFELRAAKLASGGHRGAPPVPHGGGGSGGDTIESLLEEQTEAAKANDGDRLAAINGKLRELRGRKDLFKPAEERPYFNRN
jgi:ATP-dependent protease ClpP protease subunit